MKIAIYQIGVVASYLISWLNPAIILSKTAYHKDIREYGSDNLGLTNFKEPFNRALSWFFMLLDIFRTQRYLIQIWNYLFVIPFSLFFTGWPEDFLYRRYKKWQHTEPE